MENGDGSCIIGAKGVRKFIIGEAAMGEIQAFFKKTGKSIIALTVKDILDEQIAYKLA